MPFASDIHTRLAVSVRDPVLVQAAAASQAERLNTAEPLLRQRLRADPCDVAAIRMLAELAGRLGRYGDGDAEALLRRALQLAPDFEAARANYATVLHRQGKFAAAHAEADRLLATAPEDANYLALKAAILVRTGDYADAIAAYNTMLATHPDQARLWVSLGHVLKTVGRQAEAVAAYRRAVGLDDTLGDAWWSLANLKTVKLDADDRAMMLDAIGRAATVADRYYLYFALGKALEDAADWAASFAHYKAGNRGRRSELPYDPTRMNAHARRTCALVTAADLKRLAQAGDPAADPIFVVGLPRAGSTLIEQILASHSLVEGTMELPDISTIAHDLLGAVRGRSLMRRTKRQAICPACSRSNPTAWPPWADATSTARAFSARHRDRTSLTRCRTTSRTSR